MKKLIAITLSGLLLVSPTPAFAQQPTDKEVGKPVVTTQAPAGGQTTPTDKVKTTGQGQTDKVKTTGQEQDSQTEKGTKAGTPVLGARRDAMASYNLLKRDNADVYNEEDLVTLAVIADAADLTITDLLARLTPAEGTALTVDQLLTELKLDAAAIDAEAAEIEAKLADQEDTTVDEDATAPEAGETGTTTEGMTAPTTGNTTQPADTTTTTEPTTGEPTPAGTETTTPEATPTTKDGADAELQANVARYTAILEKEPDNRRVSLKLARTYKELGQYEDAQAVTNKLLTVNSEDKLANIVAGQVMAAQGLYDGAIAKYRAALEVAAEPTTQVSLAEALDAAGQTTEAVAVMEQAAEQTQDAATAIKASKLQRKAGASDVLVYVNGKRPAMDFPPVVREGRTLVPFRALAQALNAQVNWDETTKTVTMERNGHVVVLTLDTFTATIDGQPVTLDVPAQLHNNRTFVPIRFLSKALNANVDWIDETDTVVVTPNPEEGTSGTDTSAETPAPAEETTTTDATPAEEGTTTADQTTPGTQPTQPTETAGQGDQAPATDTTAEAAAADGSSTTTAGEVEVTEPAATGA